jgi:hypothetical protein
VTIPTGISTKHVMSGTAWCSIVQMRRPFPKVARRISGKLKLRGGPVMAASNESTRRQATHRRRGVCQRSCGAPVGYDAEDDS